MVKGVRPPSMSSTENLLAPPFDESLKVICQSFDGKLADELVSWALIRRLFSLRRSVSKPKDSPLTQSKPMQAEPSTMRSSRITWSSAVRPGVPTTTLPEFPVLAFSVVPSLGARRSTSSIVSLTKEPPTMVK